MRTRSRVGLLQALVIALSLFAPFAASASSIYMSAPSGDVSVGDTIVVGVYLDTDTAPTNAVGGTIDLSHAAPVFAVSAISLDGSELTLWLQKPVLSSGGQSINFGGGLPGGFSGSHLLLFSISLTAKSSGTAAFTPTSTSLYLNDGKGTAVPVSAQTLTISVGTSTYTTQGGESAPTIPVAVVVLLLCALVLAIAYAAWHLIHRKHTSI